jgi:torso-like protein
MKNARWLGIFALAFITTFNTKECCGQSESLLRVGKAINVFIRYGYLSISMKVISYNDTERWIFKEPTKNVFKVFFLSVDWGNCRNDGSAHSRFVH